MFGTSSTVSACITAAILFTSSHALAEATPPKLEPGELDASVFRDHLGLLTDGEGHYVAVVTFETVTKDISVGKHLYYGDGERFYSLRSSGGGSSTSNKRFYRSFWAPRARKGGGGNLDVLGDVFTLTCGQRKRDLKQLDEAPRKAMLAKARFFGPKWLRHAYVLARDDEGTYYYVDRAREPPDNYDFQLYRGPRGNMKQLPLVNIVSDSEGDIFVSKRGRLRLVLDRSNNRTKRRWEWIHRKKRTDLIDVPVNQNATLIYVGLGVYDGQRLGTPCDDL